MKLGDIMIGNWIVDNGKCAQITGITCDGIIETTVNTNSNIELIEPIPLTVEILEKNGFVFITGLWYLRTKERKPIQIVFKDNNVITLSINATPIPIGLKYVHKLQNALTLCGIEKEIELWKQ